MAKRVVMFGPEWPRVIAAIGAANQHIDESIQDTTRETANRSVAKAKVGAMTIPSRKSRDRTMRSKLARGVGKRRTLHGYRVTTSMPPGEEMLPRGFEAKWRHPTFGGSPTVTQHSHYPWFTGAVAGQYPFMAASLVRDIRGGLKIVGGAA